MHHEVSKALAAQLWQGLSFADLAASLGMNPLTLSEELGPTRHRYYVYQEAENVYARFEDKARILVKTCDTPYDAYVMVQSIINPQGKTHSDFTEVSANGNQLGFLSEEFQSQISANCKAIVEAAYALT